MTSDNVQNGIKTRSITFFWQSDLLLGYHTFCTMANIHHSSKIIIAKVTNYINNAKSWDTMQHTSIESSLSNWIRSSMITLLPCPNSIVTFRQQAHYTTEIHSLHHAAAESKNVVTFCEIKSFWNNSEIISVFCFTCDHWGGGYIWNRMLIQFQNYFSILFHM